MVEGSISFMELLRELANYDIFRVASLSPLLVALSLCLGLVFWGCRPFRSQNWSMNYDIFMVEGSISVYGSFGDRANYDIFMVRTSINFYGCSEVLPDRSFSAPSIQRMNRQSRQSFDEFQGSP